MRVRNFTASRWFSPVLLLLVAVLTFGLLLPRLGFYWDDWAKLLVGRLFGLDHYTAYYAEDRPLSAWTHVIFTLLLGYRPLAWQGFQLLLRWLSAWGFFAVLEQIWPGARRQNLSAALIFLVYPAFLQHPAAVTFFQQWLQYALLFFSLLAMLIAAKSTGRRAWAWMAASLAAMLLQLTITEYFVPVELIRPLALWLLFSNAHNNFPIETRLRRSHRVIKTWAPYLAALAGYTIWRLFFIRLTGADPYRANTLFDLINNPFSTLRHLFKVISIDSIQILVGSWSNSYANNLANLAPFTLLSYAIGLATAGIVILAMMHTHEPVEDGRTLWLRQALAFGLTAMLLGPIPAWITGRQVLFDFHSDRYAMPAMFGASLVWVAACEWIAQRRLQRAVLIGVLLVLAISLQLNRLNDYRWIWTNQQRFYWQLAWRVPGMQPGTALFFENEPFPDQGLFSTSAAINLVYPQPSNLPKEPSTGETRLGYWLYTITPRYLNLPDSLDGGLGTQFRTLKFTGKLKNSLLLYQDPQVSNCLWVLSARDANSPRIPPLVKEFLPISDTSRILAESTPGYPPSDIFGLEPEHTWCYYFEKADLARQFEKWDEVVRLGDEAQTNGFHPDNNGSNSPHEWIPFIEGYAHSGQPEKAMKLTRVTAKQDPRYSAALCDLWAKDLPSAAGLEQNAPTLLEMKISLGCKPELLTGK